MKEGSYQTSHFQCIHGPFEPDSVVSITISHLSHTCLLLARSNNGFLGGKKATEQHDRSHAVIVPDQFCLALPFPRKEKTRRRHIAGASYLLHPGDLISLTGGQIVCFPRDLVAASRNPDLPSRTTILA